MALVELKTKLNQFRGENTANNPYQKSGKRDTDLESNVDINTNPERKNLSDTVDGEGRQILGQSISTQASTFLKGLKKFGVDIPIENKYENTIKRDAIFIERADDLENIVKDKREIWRSNPSKALRRQRRYKKRLLHELLKYDN